MGDLQKHLLKARPFRKSHWLVGLVDVFFSFDRGGGRRVQFYSLGGFNDFLFFLPKNDPI